MNIKKINIKARTLRSYIQDVIIDVVEPSQVENLKSSINIQGYYTVRASDIPIFRDLKAFLNMIIAVEQATEKISAKYALIGASIGEKLTIIQDVIEFRKGYKIYQSTSSIVSHYLRFARDYTISNLLPKIIVEMQELSLLCTKENFNQAADFFIENVITLENYQENYLRQKNQAKQLALGEQLEEKSVKHQDFLTVLVSKNDYYLRKFYEEDYDNLFRRSDEDNNFSLDYYPEYKHDDGVIKNVKSLLNSIIGIKKALECHGKYQNSGIFESVGYAQSLYTDIRKIYSLLSSFDYQAVIAEKSTPFINELKKQVSRWNEMLEKIACYADNFELRMRLKDGTLLQYVSKMINYYNDITSELRISVDYLIQKDVYYKSRLEFRESQLKDMDFQIKQLRRFVDFEYSSLNDIPYVIILDLQSYLKTYYNEISMNRKNLLIYTKELTKILVSAGGVFPFVKSLFDNIANYLGYTIHSELMISLRCRLNFLQEQKIYVENKNQSLKEGYVKKSFSYIDFPELKTQEKSQVVEAIINKRLNEIKEEQASLFKNPELLFYKPNESKHEIKSTDKQTLRQQNKTQQKLIEYGIFNSLLSEYKKNKKINTAEILYEVNLSPKSVYMLNEVEEYLSMPDAKI